MAKTDKTCYFYARVWKLVLHRVKSVWEFAPRHQPFQWRRSDVRASRQWLLGAFITRVVVVAHRRTTQDVPAGLERQNSSTRIQEAVNIGWNQIHVRSQFSATSFIFLLFVALLKLLMESSCVQRNESRSSFVWIINSTLSWSSECYWSLTSTNFLSRNVTYIGFV